MQEFISGVLSEIRLRSNDKRLPLASQVAFDNKYAYGQSKSTNDRVFILESKTCQVHIILKNNDQYYEKKTLFLTPQPTSYPLSLLISPCGSFLLVLTDTSAHIVDISKLESVIQPKQTKIVAKLSTVYDSLSGDVENYSRLVRARWHPFLNGFLLLLNEDGDLLFLRCLTSGANLTTRKVLSVPVLHIREQSEKLTCNDKENVCYDRKKGPIKLNLSAAMGSVCSDFDIGFPLFSTTTKIPQEGPLSAPVYVICENGDIIMVSGSPTDPSTPLVRMVRILPATEEYYTFDFDTLICMRTYKSETNPDILCFGNRAGRIFHGVCLHVPFSVLPQCNTKTTGRSVPVLYLIDSIDLELPVLCRSIDSASSEGRQKECTSELSKLALFSGKQQHPAAADYYLCVHDFGIHYIGLPWMGRLNQLYASAATKQCLDFSNDSLSFLRECPCTLKHLLLTQNICKNVASDADNPTTISSICRRCIVGLSSLPQGQLETVSSEDSRIGCETQNHVLVIFSSSPEVVTMFVPTTTLPNNNLSIPKTSFFSRIAPTTNKQANDDGDVYEPPNNVLASCPQSKESEFMRSCQRILNEDIVRLPILSTEEFSEAEFTRFFLNATNFLRTSRLSHLSGLCASLVQFADHVESQLAAQSEEVNFLGVERDNLHSHAASLTDRHSQIVERQDALNHRLSELARRLYSIDRGLTDAEIGMRVDVQNLRDRFKSGLFGWFENIRLQYDHLTARLDEAVSLSSANHCIYRHIPGEQKQAPTQLSPSQMQFLVSALKEEGNEIGDLVHAVERFNLLSTSSPSFH